MIEAQGNMWGYPADYRVITTNGFVKRNGECVMGRGCAKEAKDRYPELPSKLGTLIQAYGNVVLWLGNDLFSFPVKHKWFEKADLALIEQSCQQLINHVNRDSVDVVIPRPGCGNGQLNWNDVKPILDKYLDDRFKVITFNSDGV